MSPLDPWAVSTLGAPTAAVDEFVALARRFRFRGIEVRIEPGGFVEPTTGPDEVAAVREELAAGGLEVVAATSRHCLCSPDLDLDALRADLGTAGRLGAPGLRVFMGGGEDRAADEERAAAAVAAVAGTAASTGVLLVETHDSHPTGRDVADFVARLDREVPGTPVRIVWDAAHSWSAGESFAASFAAVASRLAYVQVKDVVSAGDEHPSPIGAGAFPLGPLADVLRDASWPGWLSLEYERTWYPDLPPLDEALESFSAWAAREVTAPRSPRSGTSRG